MAPVHPGEILREDFMKPLGLSANRLALELHVPATRIGEILNERRRITAETAMRLARYFKTNAEFWLNLQNFYDLECERRARNIGNRTAGATGWGGVNLRRSSGLKETHEPPFENQGWSTRQPRLESCGG